MRTMTSKLIFGIHFSHQDFVNAGMKQGLSDYDKSFWLNEHAPLMHYIQRQYAEKCGADYKIVSIGPEFEAFIETIKHNLMFDNYYQALQHYKHYLMEKFTEEYDQVLYIDLDVYPNTDVSIFDAIDLNNGMFVHGFHDDKPENVQTLHSGYLSYLPEPRSACVKHALMMSLCVMHDTNLLPQTPVFNTGIMLSNQSLSEQLNYTNSLQDSRIFIDRIKAQPRHFFADYIQEQYSYNNESIFSYLIHKNQVPFQSNPDWHFVHNHRNDHEPIPDHANLVHLISKRFNLITHINRINL